MIFAEFADGQVALYGERETVGVRYVDGGLGALRGDELLPRMRVLIDEVWREIVSVRARKTIVEEDEERRAAALREADRQRELERKEKKEARRKASQAKREQIEAASSSML